MRSLFLLSNRHKLGSVYNRVSNTYSLIIILFAFVAMVSFSVSNYVTKQLTFDLNANEILEHEEEEISTYEVVVKKNDTLAKILASQELPQSEISKIINKIKESKIDIVLKPGQIISFDYTMLEEDLGNDELNDYMLREVVINIDSVHSIVITQNENGYSVKDVAVPLKKMFVKYR